MPGFRFEETSIRLRATQERKTERKEKKRKLLLVDQGLRVENRIHSPITMQTM